MAGPQANPGVNQVVEAFHMMWDNFPHVVLLLKKSREIVATNKEGTKRGFLPGAKCYEVAGKTEIHATCRANVALEENTAQRSVNYNKAANRVTDAYWLPVSPETGLYVHFAVYINLLNEGQVG
jgi:hypothetical protein